ncbi:Putative short-chain dehydrogenase/reductase SDR [Modestobacter italicus]|uniref:Short-chain dehydrogenase/reductase SDR n=1 Tax=Modestobacter italicus (strain DSM 44449 / CECT 9708 / BC 501) TaxID=2732864 RepID=I4F4P8_MODI5|nr:SDR family oxidoreductase [Modestobacter marinus]CCH90611.1 Putative short-chain dehydrogenase/reductase SDR [Modestobacter marinus]
MAGAAQRCTVVTGGGRGVGRGIVERLLADGEAVVVVERDPDAAAWCTDHPAADRLRVATGSAAEPEVAEQAADLAEGLGALTGWVNNAAVFRDAALHTSSAAQVLDLITGNLAPAVVGCATAVRRMAARGGGSIVNVSSHQAQRAVRGALPYATAKAAVEGLTRAAAVDHGPAGVRVNAVALGSVETERHRSFLAGQDAGTADHVQAQLSALHPLGRIGQVGDVAGVVRFLLSDDAAWVTGVVLPVDGGRAARGADPEER